MTGRTARVSKIAFLLMAFAASFMLVVSEADARAGRGFSFGSRGSKTFSAPPPTATAPKTGAPIQRSITQPGQSTAATQTAAGATSQASRFGGLKGLLLGGLIGAGLASLFGLGGFAHVLGFLLQMMLFAGIAFLVYSFFRNRMGGGQPAMAGAAAGRGANAQPQNASYRAAPGGFGAAAPALTIGQQDYDTFERLLREVQVYYARGDLKSLGDRTTPEMLSYFAEELDANAKKGLSNDLSEPKLLQGDLAESWREANVEYATVAMRYEIIDALVNVKSGQVVSGSTTEPQEVTEIWTFQRPLNGRADQWELSAIQQTS